MKRPLRFLTLCCAIVLCVVSFTACTDAKTTGGSYDPVDPPVLSINTNGTAIDSKETYVAATVTTSNTDAAHILTDEQAEIRLRGNYSLKPDKKSYRLKFQTKQNLFGQDTGAARNWVLIANFCDKTLIRNYLAFYMARKLDGLDYTTSAQPVEVYLNEEYQGVYLLAEQVQVNEHRVNIEEGSTEVDTGYLVEMDKYLTEDKDPSDVDFYANDRPYAIKSDVVNDAQKQYIANYIQTAYAAVESGDRATIEQYIDMDSCVDMYIMHEYFKNPDVGYSSFYLYKDKGSKLYFGPLWDFDLGAGNDQRMGEGDPTGLFAGVSTNLTWLENKWFTTLMSYDWFKTLVNERWQEIQPIVDETIEQATFMTETYRPAIDRNFEKWPIYGIKQNQEPVKVVGLMTADEHLDYLTDWLTQRQTWLTLSFGGLV